MEFTVFCPQHGEVEVTLEDISSVVVRDSDTVEIVFECPVCGEPIPLATEVPNALLAAIQALEDDADVSGIQLAGLVVLAQSEAAAAGDDEDFDGERIEAYCEYFRRELSSIKCVDDALAEMDTDQRR